MDEVDDAAKGREGINSPIAKFLDDATLAIVQRRVRVGDAFLWRGEYKSASD